MVENFISEFLVLFFQPDQEHPNKIIFESYRCVRSWVCMWALPLSSLVSASAPVAVPVMMSPSERKNSAARAVSSMLTSDVRAWELKKHTNTMSIYKNAQAKG